MRIEWMMALAIAVGTVGLLQWIKGVWKTAPTLVWALASPVTCAVLAFVIGATGSLNLGETLVLALLAVAIAQLAYEVIVQGIPDLVAAVMKMIAGVVAGGARGQTVTATVTTTPGPAPPSPSLPVQP